MEMRQNGLLIFYKSKAIMTIKAISLRIIKFIPVATIKVYLLRKLFGYSIGKNVRIGKAIIHCKKVNIGDNVFIADRNVISCNELKIGSNTAIHSGNIIQGGANFYIGNNSRIINNHFFDVWSSIEIGNNTWIAGRNSQFWTHGSIHTKNSAKDLSIHIKDNVYVGSASMFCPGAMVASDNLIGVGSVVSGQFVESKTIIAGNRAKVVKQAIDWRENW
jgi:acetyltransferase-like isoleucine patch superfamily enzyme